jgi:hypothetical protein
MRLFYCGCVKYWVRMNGLPSFPPSTSQSFQTPDSPLFPIWIALSVTALPIAAIIYNHRFPIPPPLFDYLFSLPDTAEDFCSLYCPTNLYRAMASKVKPLDVESPHRLGHSQFSPLLYIHACTHYIIIYNCYLATLPVYWYIFEKLSYFCLFARENNVDHLRICVLGWACTKWCNKLKNITITKNIVWVLLWTCKMIK